MIRDKRGDGEKPGCYTPTSKCKIPVPSCPGKGCVFNDVVTLQAQLTEANKKVEDWKAAAKRQNGIIIAHGDTIQKQYDENLDLTGELTDLQKRFGALEKELDRRIGD